ncbi:MATE family efflux transporter [Alcaligenes endophyticus]|uniref:Multidrug-efflux transporter n=1 Tax=Alcaligenes endophyticus TaxID=1929088 RepID=A0ABT8EMG3_9BURK|nr:MATE family efflux transporter [Alcaligenes endophyticus]MCX5590927.1 MATE family efflux transporter [Alcaligenes endophyticus]MDN4122496.1 MATE family efflux transporter [Alcaligenes endophyticus]
MSSSSNWHTGWRPELIASCRLGAPLILTNLAQIALLTTNLVFIGQLGADDLAAASLAASLYQACMIFSMGLVSAVIPMLASTLGKNRHDVRGVQSILRHGLLSALLICLPIWFLLWHVEPILLLMEQDPAAARQAQQYMHSLQWALLPYLAYIVLRSFLAAMEKPLWSLLIASAAIIVNALLGYALVFGHFGLPALGVEGAGIATGLASAFMCTSMIWIIIRQPHFRRYHVFHHLTQIQGKVLWEMWKLGIPIAITFTLETMVFYAAVMMMGLIGKDELAAHAIAMQISAISYMIPLGFGQVATIRVGLAAGRMQPQSAALAGWTSYTLGVGYMCISACFLWLFPSLLVGIFLDVEDPQNLVVIALAAQFITLAALFQISDGAQAVAAGMLRGLHDTRTPMLLALLGYWVLGVPIGAFLAFKLGMGGVGIWIGLITGLSIVAVLLTLRWRHRSHRLLRERAVQQ